MTCCMSEANSGYRSKLKLLAMSIQTSRDSDQKPLYSFLALLFWHVFDKEGVRPQREEPLWTFKAPCEHKLGQQLQAMQDYPLTV